MRRRDARPRDVRQDRGGGAQARRYSCLVYWFHGAVRPRLRRGGGSAPKSCLQASRRARWRNEGCSGASPGTQRKRVVSSNHRWQRFIAAVPTDLYRRAFWALGLETRPPQECSRRRRHPSGTPTRTAWLPTGEGTRTTLSCALCEPQRAPQIAPRRRYQLARAATRSLSSRQDRRRAAEAAPCASTLLGLPPQHHAVAATASKPPNAL